MALAAIGPPEGLLEPLGTSGTRAALLDRPPGSWCIVRWQDGIAPYSISVLISIAQHILIFVPFNRPVAYLLQT